MRLLIPSFILLWCDKLLHKHGGIDYNFLLYIDSVHDKAGGGVGELWSFHSALD